MSLRPIRVAIVGAGPSGFYAAQALLRHKDVQVEVDFIDRLPTPFGLVRGGVAPDHQSIKKIAKAYEGVAKTPGVRFFGNVTLGRDITVAELRERYDGIIYAVGNETDRKLGIPGEDLNGVYSATEFVFWYNGHPDYVDHGSRLDEARRVAVIGNGNVAMDVARVLGRAPDELAATDIAAGALEELHASSVREVILVGRRGPAQAAYSPKEIQEIGKLESCDLVITPRYAALDPATRAWMAEHQVPANVQSNIDYVNEVSLRGEGDNERKIRCWFLASPVEFIGEEGKLTHVKFRRNELVQRNGRLSAMPTEETWLEPVQLVFKAIGYRGVPIPGVPFREDWGLIPNEAGRVLHEAGGQVLPGQYVVGWAKRGPSGLIGSNRPDSKATVEAFLEDLPGLPAPSGGSDVGELLGERDVRFVSWADWTRLDAEELRLGEERGKVREKFVSIPEMLAFLDG